MGLLSSTRSYCALLDRLPCAVYEIKLSWITITAPTSLKKSGHIALQAISMFHVIRSDQQIGPRSGSLPSSVLKVTDRCGQED